MIRTLVVEDERLFRESLKRKINRYKDFEVVGTAKNGLEGQLQIELHNPDVIFTDIRMPGQDGIEFLCEIRKRYNYGGIVVFISGYPNFEYARKALQFGAFDYITKPIIEEELNTVIHRIRTEIDYKKPVTVGKNNYDLIDLAKSFIEQNIGEATLEETAAFVRMNPSSFSRKFKQETGITFIKYLTLQKIELAKKLLKNPIIKVNEICQLLGYRDAQHFSRIFKKLTKLTPDEYRKSLLL